MQERDRHVSAGVNGHRPRTAHHPMPDATTIEVEHRSRVVLNDNTTNNKINATIVSWHRSLISSIQIKLDGRRRGYLIVYT